MYMDKLAFPVMFAGDTVRCIEKWLMISARNVKFSRSFHKMNVHFTFHIQKTFISHTFDFNIFVKELN